MTTHLRTLLAVTALLAGAPAQEQATTLSRACERADVIVLATITAATDPSPAFHRLEWRVDQLLHGQLGAAFALMEPAGACCGRSLFALTSGDQRLLFLKRTGATLHPFGGGRGVVTPTAAILAHVGQLLAAADPAARAHLLALNLTNIEPRVAHDAAHALAAMPQLTLAQADRGRVCNALRLAVQRGQTTAASLIEVAGRAADATVLDEIIPLYLDERRADRARMLRTGLGRISPALVTGRLPGLLDDDRQRQLRAAELLRELDGAHADSTMRTLLATTTCPRVKLCLAEGLLQAGAAAATLRAAVPPAVLELAERRVARPGFRSIRPGPR